MLLTETIQSSTSAIKKSRAVQDDKKAAEDYAKALGRLAQVSKALKTTLDSAAEMKNSGIIQEPAVKQHMRQELLEFAENCGRGVFEGTLTLDMVTALKTKSDSVAEQMYVVWKEAAAKYAEGPKGYLAMISGITENPAQARELADNISKTTGGPLSSTAIKKLVANVREAKKITESFSLNPEIEAFLKKVSSQQATVLDLTPTILSWLKEKKLTSKLRVRF